ncbi:YcgL domain-containing protein [Xanthomonadaceae bacterium JHOS43]|nr:YcgL domain-containing protein [Xanthomonadaceae bacterium JHOS43]MCX7564089.1 YcgL domain-containing protein [Xanthomonadaceae bacterium XH05]
MRCHVYKSRTRPDTYIYLAEKDDFDALPDALRQRLGMLEPVLEFDLTPERRLARSDAATVIAALQAQGFHLQLPPGQAETA